MSFQTKFHHKIKMKISFNNCLNHLFKQNMFFWLNINISETLKQSNHSTILWSTENISMSSTRVFEILSKSKWNILNLNERIFTLKTLNQEIFSKLSIKESFSVKDNHRRKIFIFDICCHSLIVCMFACLHVW
jgi:hypothetical protein